MVQGRPHAPGWGAAVPAFDLYTLPGYAGWRHRLRYRSGAHSVHTPRPWVRLRIARGQNEPRGGGLAPPPAAQHQRTHVWVSEEAHVDEVDTPVDSHARAWDARGETVAHAKARKPDGLASGANNWVVEPCLHKQRYVHACRRRRIRGGRTEGAGQCVQRECRVRSAAPSLPAPRPQSIPAYDSPKKETGCCEASNSGNACVKKARCALWLAAATVRSDQGPQE
eukprot:scaffold24646_cov129-Isochrysis_galbana.AAC.15